MAGSYLNPLLSAPHKSYREQKAEIKWFSAVLPLISSHYEKQQQAKSKGSNGSGQFKALLSGSYGFSWGPESSAVNGFPGEWLGNPLRSFILFKCLRTI